ncbi:MAG: glycosyltransferase family 9 protein [Thermomicrobiales bacterium]
MRHPALASLDARRVIILRALYLGDLLCSVPSMRALRQRFPNAEITLIGLPWAQDLVDRLPYLDRLQPSPGFRDLPEVPYDEQRTEQFFAACRQERYDLAIQMHGSGRSTNELVAALGAQETIGFGIAGDRYMTATVPWIEDESEILRCLRLVSLVDASASDTALEFPTSRHEEQHAHALLRALPGSGGPIVALHAGAKDPRRRWPAERFAVLADELYARFGARLILTGNVDDKPIGRAIKRHLRAPVLDLIGQTDFGAFAAVIAGLDLLVTNDTGASHVAAAKRAPSVVLFGFARPNRWAPLDRSLHTVIDAVTIGGGTRNEATALAELPVDPVLAVCSRKLEALKQARIEPSRAHQASPAHPPRQLETVWDG